VAGRLGRTAPAIDDVAPDITIENIGDPQAGARRLAEVLREQAKRTPPHLC
jgi:hypothetical protein